MKPYIKLRPFSKRPSAKEPSARFTSAEALPAAYLDGISVFETFRAYRGRLFRPELHWQRLAESCRGLGKALPFPALSLNRWLASGLSQSGFDEATLRLSVHWITESEGTLLLFVRPFKPHPPECYAKGVALDTAVSRRWTVRAQDPRIKVGQYIGSILALLDKGEGSRAQELLFFGSAGTVAEGSISNLFIVKRKRLLTPSSSSGILKGVTRALVMDLARKRGLTVLETVLTRHELYSAEECFLTNTSSEILPVTEVDGRPIGTGSPGPVTRQLAEDFKKLR